MEIANEGAFRQLIDRLQREAGIHPEQLEEMRAAYEKLVTKRKDSMDPDDAHIDGTLERHQDIERIVRDAERGERNGDG